MSLYEQEIQHNYRLLVSPDGGRDKIPLSSSYRYFVQNGDETMKELQFLRAEPKPNEAENFKAIFFLPDAAKWVAYGRCAGAPSDDSGEWHLYPETDEQKAKSEKRTSRYFITVFSKEKLFVRKEVITKMRGPKIEYVANRHVVRFIGPNGPMAYFIDHDKFEAESDYTPESK